MTGGEQVCPSCGLVAPHVDGPTDPYGASSPACWATLGRLHLVGSSQLAVDAYLAARFEGGRHAGRVDKIAALEATAARPLGEPASHKEQT